MIFICSGLPKSASTICFKYIEMSLLNFGKNNSKSTYSAYFDKWNAIVFFKLIVNSLLHKKLIIKTHSPPSLIIRLLINLNMAKAIYTIRDPRDIILSTIDYKGVSANQHEFSNYTTIKNTTPSVKNELNNYLKWKKFKSVLFINYEDIFSQPEKTIKHINDYFGISIESEKIKEIVSHFDEHPVETVNKKLLNRYKTEMTTAEIDFCNSVLGNHIKTMGYHL